MRVISFNLLTAVIFSLMLPYVFSQDEVVIYNLISGANDPQTEWATGTLPTRADHAIIPFGQGPNINGMVRYHVNAKLNDGRQYPLLLETHPKWVDNGYIQGHYHAPVYVPVSGAKLRVKVGFLEGGFKGRATVQINLIVPGSTPRRLIPLLNQEIAYADGVKEFTVDFPSETYGNYYEIVLFVSAGETSEYDWVAWERIWITARVGAALTTTTTSTTTVTSTTTSIILAIQTMHLITLMFIGALIIAALILILLVGLMRRRTIEGERFQQAVSGELLRKAKLAELEKLRALGKISEEAYRRMREELGD
jgi:uncharacterized membrane protein